MIATNRITPLLELAGADRLPAELGPVATVGGDRHWPRADLEPRGGLTVEDLAAWVRDHAREELDELLFVRRSRGGVATDVALGLSWRPCAPWVEVARVDELGLGEDLERRIEAALARVRS